jgi:PPOX class probable F420-dependent enzyme
MPGLGDLQTLLDGPAAAVLTTYRSDGTAATSPVWVRQHGGALEVVIVEGDAKLAQLRRDPRCALVVFEATRPFRGIEARGEAQLVQDDVTEARAEIAARYLGPEDGARFVAERASKPGVLVRLPLTDARIWDLSRILPLAAAD